MSKEEVFISDALHEIGFCGDRLLVVMREGNAYVALRPLAGFLGLTWPPQYQRIMRDDILSRYVISLTMVGADRRQRKMVCLRLEYLPGWLFGIVPNRVKPELAQKLMYYREYCFCVLWSALQSRVHNAGPLVHSWVGKAEMSDEAVQLQAQVGVAYYQHAREAVWSQCSRARKMGLPATLTVEEWLGTIEFFRGLCAYYQAMPGVILEHFIPLTPASIGTTVDNCVPSCYACNAKKGNRHPDDIDAISGEVLERIRFYLISKSPHAR